MQKIENQIYLAHQVRELDRIAIDEFNIPSFTLMQRAAEAAFKEIQCSWSDVNHITVLVGTGNNGGDGYVIAGLALASNYKVEVLQVGDHSNLQGDAKKAHDFYIDKGGQCKVFADEIFSDCNLIVDALLGTGLTREVKRRICKSN